MNDFDGLLTSEYGFKTTLPVPSATSTSSFDLDSIYDKPPWSYDEHPVYDRPPVYDDDIFEGVPGIKTASSSSSSYSGFGVGYDRDDVTATGKDRDGDRDGDGFEELLGGFLGGGKDGKEAGNRSGGGRGGGAAFDGLLPGFSVGSGSGSGGTSTAPPERHTSNSSWSSEPIHSSIKVMDDPFVSLEATSSPQVTAPSSLPTAPLEELGNFSKSGSVRDDSLFGSSGRAYDESDPFDDLGKFTSKNRNIGKNGRSLGADWSASQVYSSNERVSRNGDAHFDEPALVIDESGSNHSFFDIPTASGDSFKPVGWPNPIYEVNPNDFGSPVGMSPRFERKTTSYDEVWLTVSEIPLYTQPTTTPPPSGPPPPRPARTQETGNYPSGSTNSSKNANEYSFDSTAFDDLKSVPPAYTSLDELEDFAMGRNINNADTNNGFYIDDIGINADAAAAMKETIEGAEAKFGHMKEVRERENNRTAKNRETLHPEMDRHLDDDYERVSRDRQERLDRERLQREKEDEERAILEKDREREEREIEQRRLEKERDRAREIERERNRQAVERATREARERAAAEARDRAAAEARMKAERAAVEKANAEARERAQRAAVQRAQVEARERAAADARARAEKAAAEAREREVKEGVAEAHVKAERAAVEKAAAEARVRVAAEARERAATEVRKRAASQSSQQKADDNLESFFEMGNRASRAPTPSSSTSASETMFNMQSQIRKTPNVMRTSTSQSNIRKAAASSANIVDDLSSIFGGVSSSGEFQDVEGETGERRRAQLERHQRTQERVAKALAEKNQRDLQAQTEQAERHRIAETLDIEIKRWAAGKEGNLRALLSTLQYVLWPECGWQPVSLMDLITGASVKKVYRKATLCIHPDKVQQKGANLQQKYIAEKVFDLLKFSRWLLGSIRMMENLSSLKELPGQLFDTMFEWLMPKIMKLSDDDALEIPPSGID